MSIFERKINNSKNRGIENLFKKVRSIDSPDLIVIIISLTVFPKIYLGETNNFLRGMIIVGIFFLTGLYIFCRHRQSLLKINKKFKRGGKKK